jgi:hypothetical protein
MTTKYQKEALRLLQINYRDGNQGEYRLLDIYNLIRIAAKEFSAVVLGKVRHQEIIVKADLGAWGRIQGHIQDCAVCLAGAVLLKATDNPIIYTETDFKFSEHKGLSFLDSLRYDKGWEQLKNLGFNVPQAIFSGLPPRGKEMSPESLLRRLRLFLRANKGYVT